MVYEKIRIIMIEVKANPCHVLMCKSVADGGYKGARTENDDVRILSSMLRVYWLNWLMVMNDNDCNMCACKTCQTISNLHTAYIAKRRKIVARTEAKLYDMPDRFRSDQRVKSTLAKDLKEYKNATFVPVPGRPDMPIHADGWEACEQYGCRA